MGKQRNAGEDESILDSIDEFYIENEYDDGSINTNALEDIWDVKYIHPGINTRDDRFKIRDHIRQMKR